MVCLILSNWCLIHFNSFLNLGDYAPSTCLQRLSALVCHLELKDIQRLGPDNHKIFICLSQSGANHSARKLLQSAKKESKSVPLCLLRIRGIASMISRTDMPLVGSRKCSTLYQSFCIWLWKTETSVILWPFVRFDWFCRLFVGFDWFNHTLSHKYRHCQQ